MCYQLLDIVYREETLLNVIRSVTKNGRSILLTAVLAFILIYLFSIVGFIFFKDDFMLEVDALDSGDVNGEMTTSGNRNFFLYFTVKAARNQMHETLVSKNT